MWQARSKGKQVTCYKGYVVKCEHVVRETEPPQAPPEAGSEPVLADRPRNTPSAQLKRRSEKN